MVANNQERIKSLRKSINELIKVLDAQIKLDDDYTGSDIRSSVKIKKNAFVSAKNLLANLQQLESEKNENWYKDTITRLKNAAEAAMTELSDIMRKPVNLKESGSAINSAIDAKPEAYEYMNEIFYGVIELNEVLKSIDAGEGVKDLNTSDYKVGLAEAHAYDGLYPKRNRKIQPGYNKKLDAIVISYDGTVGEIIECYGLRIALPKAPKKTHFPNYRKKPHLQYWERPQLPKDLNKDTATAYADIIEEEFRRRDEGYWFMNNGKPEYITGAHYMLLTHFKADAEQGSYFHFRKAHRDLFYWLEAAWVDNRSLGVILGKTRRTGATHVAAAFLLTKGIGMRNAHLGLTSKKNTDASRAFEKISTMFKEMPFFFKPLNTGEGFKKLQFKTPSKKTTKKSQHKEVKYEDLNTTLDYESTAENSYDSMALSFYVADEFSKWPEGLNILSHWSKVRKTLLSGGIVRGKAFVLSTVEGVTGNDAEDDNARNGDRFKKLYYDSDLSTRNPKTQRTKSGLYKIFISSLDNFGGFIDKYGNCISETPEEPIEGVNGETITMGVREFLESEWSQYKDDPAALNDEMRKDPITEEDMFRVASKDSMFNIIKIQDQIDYNNEVYLSTGDRGYLQGNFRYKNNDPDGDVEFIEQPNGRFKVAKWLIDYPFANQYVMKYGKRAPKFQNLGCIGVDPYKVHHTVDKRGSKGAIVGYIIPNPYDELPNDEFFLVYNARPQTKDIFFEDVIMALKYCSMQALIENNIPELLIVLYQRGLTLYSMRRPDKKKLTQDEMMYGGIPSNDLKLLGNQATFLESYIENHIGYATTDEYRQIGEIGNCPFNDLLYDWIKFDVHDRTKFDLSVASGLALYGAQKYMIKTNNKRKLNTSFNAKDFYDFV